MKKITILDAFEPFKQEFVPIKQAINQGLFNTSTYLYFNPAENRHYSITEAEKNGFLRLAIDQRPEALVVERIKVSQQVSLVSARDPQNRERLVPISQAIYLGIVDNKAKVYVDSVQGKDIDLGDAFDSDLIQGHIVGEITEKVTETLTEQKNPDTIGLLKKTETHTYGMGDEEPMELTRVNGVFVFDRTKSVSINKMIKKFDDEVMAGFVSDPASCRILEHASTSHVIDFGDALAKNLIIMPDSLTFEQHVLYALDLSTGNKFDFEAACQIGLIDVKNRTFFDTKLNKSISLFEALAKNYIVMRDELNTNYDQSQIDDHSNSVSYLDLKSMFDPSSGVQITLRQALDLGILSKDKQFYVDLYNGKKMCLHEAVEKGLAMLKPERVEHKVDEGYQYLVINGVLDPVQNKEMSLAEAINCGLLDYAESEFHDPLTGQTMSLLDAYDKGYLKTTITDSNQGDLASDCGPTESPAQSLDRQSRVDTGPSKLLKSHSVSPKRSTAAAKFRSASAYDVKSVDKLSTMSRKSVMSKIKSKLLGKRAKYNQFNEYLIQQSMKIVDTKSKEIYQLREAIEHNLIRPNERIVDAHSQQDYSVVEAIENGLIKFFHPLNNFEFKYDQSCSVFKNEFLLLVNYVVEPRTKRKIGLKSAFQNEIINKERSTYFKKKHIDIIKAIEKSYISCEIINLDLLKSIIASNVFKLCKDPKLPLPPLPPPSPPTSPPASSPPSQHTEATISEHDAQSLAEYGQFEQKGELKGQHIPEAILEQSGLKYNPYGRYCIGEVYDSDKAAFVSLKKALFLQIFNAHTNEYVDSASGQSMSLLKAVQRGKIRLKQTERESSVAKSFCDYDEIGEDEPRLTSTLKSFTQTYESLADEEVDAPRPHLADTLSVDSTPSGQLHLDIVNTLLYKKSSNGRYIRFDRVLKHRLYNTADGTVVDIVDIAHNRHSYSLYDALKKGLLRLNDQNVLFDEHGVYVVDYVLANSRKISLAEAVQKKLVDKSKQIVKFLNKCYTFNEAFRNGYFHAKLITFAHIKQTLDDYAKRKENKLKKFNRDTVADLYTPVSVSKANGPDFGIFDRASDSYVCVSEALETGVLLNDPVRVLDSASGNYMLLKDAVVKGLVSCEPRKMVDFKSCFLAHSRKSYIVDCVYDPRKTTMYSLTDAIKTGVFNNGTYKNFLQGKLLTMDEAIEHGFIRAKLIDLDLMETSVRRWMRLQSSSSPAPRSKSSRGAETDEEEDEARPRAKSVDARSRMEPFSARIVSVQDVLSGKYIKVDDAVKFGLINFREGNFKNSLTNQTLSINDAMNAGFILVESNVDRLASRRRAQSVRSSRTLDSAKASVDFLETSRIELGSELKILSVLDPVRREYLSLSEAVETGIFDVNTTMYVDGRTGKKLTMVEAIDQNLIKIGDKNFRPSFKLTVEQTDRNFVKNIKTLCIRFIVDLFTQQVVPVNVASHKKLINTDNGTYVAFEKIIGLKEAYDKCLALTCDDLDRHNSARGKFRVVCVRKSTTGKNMSLKSALAKNWINLERRVYIDKMTNEEMPFSQAVDMDLLVLKSSADDQTTLTENTSKPMSRSKSKDGYFNSYTSRIF
ncbi:microtubule-actin cross-linking factor 1-like isoform X4 [Brachionus plicatilis]|uniref:Microtubule-actin cross-linking factor 1-like isoform X4 n=1 Tax=Brachionus plicatilis TaxID=10195 RepID=A0A3M7T953_BRAPC|nr:microtubule-actin cross-linking factor 1-like isoform X4 [Brachionus plicatilis]